MGRGDSAGYIHLPAKALGRLPAHYRDTTVLPPSDLQNKWCHTMYIGYTITTITHTQTHHQHNKNTSLSSFLWQLMYVP